MRMSQDLARNIAVKMTVKKQKEVDRLLKAFQDYVREEYVKQTPKEVLSTFKKNPDWFSVTTSIKLEGFGWNWHYVSVTGNVLCNCRNDARIKLNAELSKSIKSYETAYDKAKEDLKKLRSEIETALNGLRSFSQIQKNLPEAVPYLPKSSSVELMINLEDLRTKIKAA